MSATPQDANSANTAEIRDRLEYLRGEIRAERISYGELAELQDLAEQIDPGDVELLQWAGVPEFPRCKCGKELDDNGDHDGGYGAACA